MKKTIVAAIAIVAAIVIVLAAAVALVQYQSPSASGSGKLAIIGTDPAVAASGVSDATIAYSSVYAHTAGSDMVSGWTQVSGSGSMDLMASQGTAQTLASSQVNAATYDAFKFNVDSCKVFYQGQSYVTTVASTTITAQSQSKVQVNSSSTAAAVVDLRTFIENTGSSSNPQFVFSATAEATNVPPSTLGSLSLQVGATASLSAQSWWSTFMSQTSASLNVGATLSSSSMVLEMQNSGNANAEIQEVIITPVSAWASAGASLPSSFSSSAIFTVSSSGTVQQSSSLQATALLSSGVTVSSGSAANLNFNGDINIGTAIGGVQVAGVVTGQQYIITCIGANTYASTTVVAS
ncbi:MAG: DUF4382 domain-containing protein [Nitrososphaerota archaeon]|nr:DUF4382 domain-containing protein [Nitrososphaerota archaeon]